MSKAWSWLPLFEVAPPSSNSMPSVTAEVWNLSLEDIESGTGRILQRRHCKVDELGSSKCVFDTRHVLYSKLRPYLNKVVVPDSVGVGTSELIPLLPKDNCLNRDFLASYLRSPQFREFSAKHTRGANLPRIAMDDLWKHKVPVPSLQIQEQLVGRITSMNERLDEIESLSQDVSKELNELKRSLVLGTCGHKRNRSVLADLVEWVQDSEQVKPRHDYTFAGIKSFGKGLFVRGTVSSDDFAYKSLRRLKCGDFIFPKLMAWEGAFAMVTEQYDGMVVSPEFVVFRPKVSRMCSEVLDTYFRSPLCLEDVNKASTGSNRRRRRLNPRAFLTLTMPVPSEDEQKKLKAVYKLESDAEEAWQNRSEKLKAIRDSILRKAFAGEL